jgi:hypothetical protein
VKRFFEPKPYRVIREDDTDAGECRWRVYLLRKPPLIRWSALAGDCLYDLRSALDQLAYALAVAHTGDPLPKKIADKSAFPLFVRKPKNMSTLNRRIAGIDPDAQAIIKKLQPYIRRDRSRESNIRLALGYLDSLCNYDKHRLPLVLSYHLGGFGW